MPVSSTLKSEMVIAATPLRVWKLSTDQVAADSPPSFCQFFGKGSPIINSEIFIQSKGFVPVAVLAIFFKTKAFISLSVLTNFLDV